MSDKKTAPRRGLNIRDRVVELRRVGRGEVLPNPNNFRTHPEAQREALRGILSEVGIAGAGLAYHSERNGGRLTFIDGHLRDEEIAEQFPVLVTDLNDAEADLLLATYDPLAAMAGADKARLDALLREVSTGEAAVQSMLSELAEANGVIPPDGVAQSPDPGGSKYQEQYGVIVICGSEAEQEHAYNKLKAEGYTCRVVVT